jgi:AraC family transcriptional regulator
MMIVAGHIVGRLPEWRLQRVAQYVHDNLHRELRLAELSGLVHMSPYHFARLFKQSTGVSPHRFLVQRRIEQARALLGSQTLPIAETGITPSVYRSGEEASRRRQSG